MRSLHSHVHTRVERIRLQLASDSCTHNRDRYTTVYRSSECLTKYRIVWFLSAPWVTSVRMLLSSYFTTGIKHCLLSACDFAHVQITHVCLKHVDCN